MYQIIKLKFGTNPIMFIFTAKNTSLTSLSSTSINMPVAHYSKKGLVEATSIKFVINVSVVFSNSPIKVIP